MLRSARYHLIFDMSECREADEATIKAFIVDTIASINMKIISGPVVCEGVPENPGLSGFAVLDFSHVSIHTFTKYNEILVDIFSCKPFDREVVRGKCVKYFATKNTSFRAKEVWWG